MGLMDLKSTKKKKSDVMKCHSTERRVTEPEHDHTQEYLSSELS